MVPKEIIFLQYYSTTEDNLWFHYINIKKYFFKNLYSKT